MSTLQELQVEVVHVDDQPRASTTTSGPVSPPTGDPRFVRRAIGTGVMVWIVVLAAVIGWVV